MVLQLARFSVAIAVVMVSTLDTDTPAVKGNSGPAVFEERLLGRKTRGAGGTPPCFRLISECYWRNDAK